MLRDRKKLASLKILSSEYIIYLSFELLVTPGYTMKASQKHNLMKSDEISDPNSEEGSY